MAIHDHESRRGLVYSIFEDAHWLLGPAPFGDTGKFRTKWDTIRIWLRRHFDPGTVSPEHLQRLVMTQLNRGRVEIFINDVQTFAQQGNNRAIEGPYEHRPLSTAVRMAIKPNADNVIAVHCHKQPAGGPLFFDAGLALRNT